MQFTTFFSVALALVASVAAIPTPSSESQGLAARDADTAIFSRGMILETRKAKWEKVPLAISTKPKIGTIKQNELLHTEELGQKALYQAGELAGGAVVCGWHDLHSEDPVEHFTIEPTAGKAGRIHVHRDGSWSQGTPGPKQKKGDGQV